MFIKNLLHDTLLAPRLLAPDLGGGTGGEGGDPAGNDGNEGGQSSESGNEGSGGGDPKTYTRDELASIANAQVKTALEKYEKEKLPGLLQKKYDEGKADAGLSAEELADKHKTDREKKLDAREAELNQRDALTATKSLLTSKGLPDAFAKYLSDTDESKRTTNVSEFEKMLQGAVHDAVLKKTEGRREPYAGGNPSGNEGGGLGKRLAGLDASQNAAESHYFSN